MGPWLAVGDLRWCFGIVKLMAHFAEKSWHSNHVLLTWKIKKTPETERWTYGVFNLYYVKFCRFSCHQTFLIIALHFFQKSIQNVKAKFWKFYVHYRVEASWRHYGKGFLTHTHKISSVPKGMSGLYSGRSKLSITSSFSSPGGSTPSTPWKMTDNCAIHSLSWISHGPGRQAPRFNLMMTNRVFRWSAQERPRSWRVLCVCGKCTNKARNTHVEKNIKPMPAFNARAATLCTMSLISKQEPLSKRLCCCRFRFCRNLEAEQKALQNKLVRFNRSLQNNVLSKTSL